MTKELFDLKPKHPGEYLKQKLAERGWTQGQLAAITGKSSKAISDIARGTAGVSPDMAVTLSAAFGNNAEDWLRWDAQFRLSFAERESEDRVRRAARLHNFAPVKDMERRGWIRPKKKIADLEAELQNFFCCDSLDDDVIFPVAAKRTITLGNLNPAEKAWCFRARFLATTVHAKQFSPDKLKPTQRKLRRLAAYPREAARVTETLAACGIRFVVVEPLPSARIDGAAFWLDERSPVIALSLRFDRMDSFWFTLMHEFRHIANGDSLSVDTDLIAEGDHGVTIQLVKDRSESRANNEAADALIPKRELDSFIRRVGPLYHRERIVQFSHRVKIHPAIVVGQLQNRGEIGYSALRDFLVKIRRIATSSALTDGWKQSITPISTP